MSDIMGVDITEFRVYNGEIEYVPIWMLVEPCHSKEKASHGQKGHQTAVNYQFI